MLKKLRRNLLLNQRGFTLIEMMIVIAIIGLIGGLVTTKIMSRFEEAKISSTRIQVKQLGVVLDDFRRVCGFYPSTDQGLEALVKAPTMGRECKNYDPEGFLKKVPQDAWNRPFSYESDGNKYVLKSLGPNGKEGEKNISSEEID